MVGKNILNLVTICTACYIIFIWIKKKAGRAKTIPLHQSIVLACQAVRPVFPFLLLMKFLTSVTDGLAMLGSWSQQCAKWQ
jgi:hypothetical protein